MPIVASFIAGFVSTLLFHQGLVALLAATGAPITAYDMSATWPLGVPQVISLAFWGGVWGVILWFVIGVRTRLAYWGYAVLIGAVAPTVVAMGVVFPLKGIAITATKVAAGLILNGVWGLGVALLMKLYWVTFHRSSEETAKPGA